VSRYAAHSVFLCFGNAIHFNLPLEQPKWFLGSIKKVVHRCELEVVHYQWGSILEQSLAEINIVDRHLGSVVLGSPLGQGLEYIQVFPLEPVCLGAREL